jgi:hypothetical protein
MRNSDGRVTDIGQFVWSGRGHLHLLFSTAGGRGSEGRCKRRLELIPGLNGRRMSVS